MIDRIAAAPHIERISGNQYSRACQPVIPRNADCTGPVNKQLVACLQPDRRVHVEVTGARIPLAGTR